jgi:O-antigen/teichoic acid export membrane protein
VGEGQQEAALSLYHRGTQWLAALSLPVTALVVVFSHELLYLWTRNDGIASAGAPILSVLALAMTLNLVASMPYVLQLAHGWTSLALKCNLAVALLAVPLLQFAGHSWGPLGAAWVVVGIHASFVFVTVPLMHRRLAVGELRAWYLRDLAPVVLSVSATMGLCALFVQVPRSAAGAIALLGALLLGTIAVALLCSAAPRAVLLAAMRRVRSA